MMTEKKESTEPSLGSCWQTDAVVLWEYGQWPAKEDNAGRRTEFAPGKSLRFFELFLELSLFEFRFTVFFSLGCGVDSWIPPPPSVFSNRERKSPQRGLGRLLERWRYQCNFPAPHEPQLSEMRCVTLNQIDLIYMICVRFCMVLCLHYSTLSSPLPFRCEKISRKGRVFRSFVWSGFIRKLLEV